MTIHSVSVLQNWLEAISFSTDDRTPFWICSMPLLVSDGIQCVSMPTDILTNSQFLLRTCAFAIYFSIFHSVLSLQEKMKMVISYDEYLHKFYVAETKTHAVGNNRAWEREKSEHCHVSRRESTLFSFSSLQSFGICWIRTGEKQ